MTSRPIKKPPATRSAEKFPDFPPGTTCRTPSTLAQPSQSSSPLECTSHLGFSLGDLPSHGYGLKAVWLERRRN